MEKSTKVLMAICGLCMGLAILAGLASFADTKPAKKSTSVQTTQGGSSW